MGFAWIIPLLVFLLILSLIMSVMAATGLSFDRIIFAFRATRRVRTESDPRDHFDRWVHSHRRSAMANKPRDLTKILTTGDADVPLKLHGWVKGLEPWKSYYVVFVKSRRWTWSVPYLIDQRRCSDINRKNMWVSARGFSSMGPIRVPIPLDGEVDLEKHLIDHLNGFRSSFEGQGYMDITEDMAWDIANAMSPPMTSRISAAQVEQPQFTDREFLSEEKATGG